MKATVLLSLLLSIPFVANARPRISPADHARATMRQYADCISGDEILDKLAAVGKFLRASPNSVEGRRFAVVLAGGQCLGNLNAYQDLGVERLKFKSELLRGELFRALYLYQFKKNRPITLLPIDAQITWRLPNDDGYMLLQQFGECVVRSNPEQSRIAINSLVGSDTETRAYNKLLPNFSACVGAGSTIRFSRSVLEGAMAEALFHLSGGQVPPTTWHS